MAVTIFLLQSCATIVKGTSQKIPVTSAPIGAKVLVDGTEMGTTPRLEITEIDAARLRDLKWLRIRTAAALDRY